MLTSSLLSYYIDTAARVLAQMIQARYVFAGWLMIICTLSSTRSSLQEIIHVFRGRKIS
jgi:hypothetical protein